MYFYCQLKQYSLSIKEIFISTTNKSALITTQSKSLLILVLESTVINHDNQEEVTFIVNV